MSGALAKLAGVLASVGDGGFGGGYGVAWDAPRCFGDGSRAWCDSGGTVPVRLRRG